MPAYPPTPPSEEDLANALSGRFGTVPVRFRFYHADNNNALLADLTNAFDAPRCTITLDNDRPIVRMASFTISQPLMPEDFDYLTSNVAVFADVKITGQWWRFQLGLFRLDAPSELLGFSDQDFVTVNASDLSVLLMQPGKGEPYTVAAGTNYTIAVAAVLDSLSLRYTLPGTAHTTPIAFTWQPKTPPMTIANDLLSGINHFGVWADEYGEFTTRERVSPSTDTIAVAYRTSQEPRMIRNPVLRRTTAVRPPNRIIAAIRDPLRVGSAGVAENVDPFDPSSVINAEVALQEFNVDRIVNTSKAADWAAYKLRELAGTGRQIQLSTHFDPRRRAHEIYQLTYFSFEVETLWRVVSWTMTLGVGQPMLHTLDYAPTLSVSKTEVLP